MKRAGARVLDVVEGQWFVLVCVLLTVIWILITTEDVVRGLLFLVGGIAFAFVQERHAGEIRYWQDRTASAEFEIGRAQGRLMDAQDRARMLEGGMDALIESNSRARTGADIGWDSEGPIDQDWDPSVAGVSYPNVRLPWREVEKAPQWRAMACPYPDESGEPCTARFAVDNKQRYLEHAHVFHTGEDQS